jgi:hypothetical protein
MASQQQNDSTSPMKGGKKSGQKQGPKPSQNLGQKSDVQGTADDDTGYEQTGFRPDRARDADH